MATETQAMGQKCVGGDRNSVPDYEVWMFFVKRVPIRVSFFYTQSIVDACSPRRSLCVAGLPMGSFQRRGMRTRSCPAPESSGHSQAAPLDAPEVRGVLQHQLVGR